MRNNIESELSEESELPWFLYRFGFLEIRLNTSEKNIYFEILASVTKATNKGNCVRFPKVELCFRVPSYKIMNSINLDSGLKKSKI